MKTKAAAAIRQRSRAQAARTHTKPVARISTFTDVDDRPLNRCVEAALTVYFAALDGEQPCGLYDLVMAEVERPMLECVMRYVAGNQCRAAAVLGVSRGTLRKKLIQHSLLEH